MANLFNPNLINPYNFFNTEYLQFNETDDKFTFYTQRRGELNIREAKYAIELPWYPIAEKASFSLDEFLILIKTKMKYEINRARMSQTDKEDAIEFYSNYTVLSLNDLSNSIKSSKGEEKEKAILNFLEYACDYTRACTLRNEILYGYEGMWDGFAFKFVSAKPVKVSFSFN